MAASTRIRLLLLAALTLGLLALAVPRPAAAEIHQITAGELNWGVKESWRNYVGGGVTSEGATVNPDGTFKFPLESGTYDDETRTTVLNFSGQVWFRSWWEYIEPGKWALDTTYRDLQVVISPTEQVIRGTHIGYDQSDPGGELHTDEDVVLATLDVAGASPAFGGGQTDWPGVVTLAGPGLRIYTTGAQIDPVSISYTGPGGVPDLGEDLGTPGYISLDDVAGHITDWPRELFTRSNGRVFTAGDGSGLSFVEMRSADDADAALRFTRLHPETLATVGAPLTLTDYPFHGARSYGRYFSVAHDPETDSVFFLKGGMGDDQLGVWMMRARWDDAAQTFAVDKVGDFGSATIDGADVRDAPAGAIAWNDVLDEVAILAPNPASADEYDQHALVRFRRTAGAWERVVSVLRAPDTGAWAGAANLNTPWGLTVSGSAIPTNDMAVARDGSYVLPSLTAGMAQPDPANPGESIHTKLPSAHIAIDGDQATPGYIPGTVAEEHPVFATYYGWTSASRSHDGSVLIHNSQWGLESFVRVDIAGGEAVVVGDVYRSYDALPPYLTSTMGRAVAADPVNGWDWVADTSDPDAWVLNAFHQVGGEDVILSRHRQSEFVAQAYGAPPAVGPNGDVYLLVQDTGVSRTEVRRLAYRGVFARIGDQPQARTVSLEAGEQSETVTFSSTAVGGDPVPVRRWQVRPPGSSSFTDVEGETGETLEVEATREADGSRYRAVYDSAAGTIASEPATLDVRYAPEVVNEPADVTVEAGQPALFVVMPGGKPQPEVTWQVRVSGVWQDVDLDSGQFAVSGDQGGFLEVRDTNTDLSGTLFRARLRNNITPGSEAWSTTFTREARLTVSEPAAEPVWFDTASSTVDWGIVERFRCYVTGSIARGEIVTSGPVSRLPGTTPVGSLCTGSNPSTGQPWGTGGEAFRFGLGEPVFHGAEPLSHRFDPDTGMLRVDLGGDVRFIGHRHHSPTGTALLDTLIYGLRVEANLQTGEGLVYANAIGATMADPTPVTRTNVKLAYFDASGLALTPVNGRVRVDDVPTFLHEEGTAIFGDYPVGEPFDPLSLDLAVGAKPQPRPPQPPPPAPDPPAGPGPATPPSAKVSVRQARVLRARTALATVACPPSATAACRVTAPKRLRLRTGAKLTRAQRAQLRKGGRLGVRRVLGRGRSAKVVLRLTGTQRRALRGVRVRGSFRLRVAVPGGSNLARTVRVSARVR